MIYKLEVDHMHISSNIYKAEFQRMNEPKIWHKTEVYGGHGVSASETCHHVKAVYAFQALLQMKKTKKQLDQVRS